MQPSDLFSLSTLIDQVHQWSGPWLTALLPWLEFFLGIALVFIAGAGIVRWILSHLGDTFGEDGYEDPSPGVMPPSGIRQQVYKQGSGWLDVVEKRMNKVAVQQKDGSIEWIDE